MNKYKMKKMLDFERAMYQGFTLKSGFWYGRNLRGQAIASSLWQINKYVAIYVRSETGWKLEWHHMDAWYLPDELKDELSKKFYKKN